MTDKLQNRALNSLKDTVSIYTTPYFMKYFEMERLKAKVIALPVQKMGRAFLESGKENDICIMPFFSNCIKILEMLRISQCIGPVIFITHTPVEPEITGKIPGLGAILLDMRYERTDFIYMLLRYLTEKDSFRSRSNCENQGEANRRKQGESKHRENVKSKQGDEKITRNPSVVAARLRSFLKEKFGSAEQLPVEAVLKRQDLSTLDFSFSFKTESQTQIRELPIYCMARLSHAEEESSPAPHSLLIFGNIYPDFSLSLLKEIASQTTPDSLKQALASVEYGKTLSNIVQFEVETDCIPRTCIMLPILTDIGELGFVPLTNFFLQKRRFFRIAPSLEHPLTAMVSSVQQLTHKVPVVDISERGISFLSMLFLPINSEISLYLHWNEGDIVCRGIVRSISKSEFNGKDKIGAEIFLHPKEITQVRMYIFNNQLSIFKALQVEKKALSENEQTEP